MTKFKSSNVSQSFANAIKGLKLAIFSQRNFVIELIISGIVLFAALYLKFSLTHILIVIITIAFVLVCELFNSVIEFTLDAVYKNNYSKLVEMAKDISAGCVLLAIFISIIIGILLFGFYLFNVFTFE